MCFGNVFWECVLGRRTSRSLDSSVSRNSKRKTHCNTLQHTVIRCRMCSLAAHLEILGLFRAAEFKEANTLQHAATRCNTLQHAATRCITLQHAATHCRMCSSAAHLEILGLFRAAEIKEAMLRFVALRYQLLNLLCCSVLQCVAVCCSMLQRVAVCCNAISTP